MTPEPRAHELLTRILKQVNWAGTDGQSKQFCIEYIDQALAEAQAAVWREAAEKCDKQMEEEDEFDRQGLCEMLRNLMLIEWQKCEQQARGVES